MNMHYIKKLLFTILLFTFCDAFSQNSFSTLGESAFGINHKVSDKYSINFTGRSRYFLYKNEGLLYEQQLFDLYHFSTFNLTYSHKLSLGLFYRHRANTDIVNNEVRLMQQFNYVKQKLGVHYTHRFRAEQRFFEEITIFRQRYRFSVDFPLNGEKLDIGEGYFMGSIECLISLSTSLPPLTDLRTTAIIGWQVSKNLKLQTGLEHRLESFNQRSFNLMFLLTTAILKV